VTEDVFFKFDFLDPVSNDLPKGCWSLQSDPSKTKVRSSNFGIIFIDNLEEFVMARVCGLPQSKFKDIWRTLHREWNQKC